MNPKGDAIVGHIKEQCVVHGIGNLRVLDCVKAGCMPAFHLRDAESAGWGRMFGRANRHGQGKPQNAEFICPEEFFGKIDQNKLAVSSSGRVDRGQGREVYDVLDSFGDLDGGSWPCMPPIDAVETGHCLPVDPEQFFQ